MAMGPIDSDGRSVRRTANSEINMVPMIDLLVCCIAFLLITAVWSRMARVNCDALVPGTTGPSPAPPGLALHVDARTDGIFTLTWKQGATVVSTLAVPRREHDELAGSLRRYPDLGAKIRDEWLANGSHRDASDRSFDQAVLHTGDAIAFGEIVAIIDAIHTPKRETRSANAVPAFNVVFAIN